eukprot:COSAG05_NODE_16004_length_356_cov_0.544747_1_plen_80_part_10
MRDRVTSVYVAVAVGCHQLDKNVDNYKAMAQGRLAEMYKNMHDELNKNVAEHHAASAVALAAQAAAGPGGDAGLSAYRVQ